MFSQDIPSPSCVQFLGNPKEQESITFPFVLSFTSSAADQCVQLQKTILFFEYCRQTAIKSLPAQAGLRAKPGCMSVWAQCAAWTLKGRNSYFWTRLRELLWAHITKWNKKPHRNQNLWVLSGKRGKPTSLGRAVFRPALSLFKWNLLMLTSAHISWDTRALYSCT